MRTQWTITKDYDPEPKARPGTNNNAVGIVTPNAGATYIKVLNNSGIMEIV